MVGRDLKVPGMAEEPGKIRGKQPDKLPAGAVIAILRSVEQSLEPDRIAHFKPAAPLIKEFTVAFEQLDAREL
jgi:hypothetical protein